MNRGIGSGNFVTRSQIALEVNDFPSRLMISGSGSSLVQWRGVFRVRFKTSSRVTELSEHEADGGKFQEREGVAVEVFPILGETAATVEPGDRAFDDPSLG